MANNAIQLVDAPQLLIDSNGHYSLVLTYLRGYWDGNDFSPDETEMPYAQVQIFGAGNPSTGSSTVSSLIATAIGNISTVEGYTLTTTPNTNPAINRASVYHT